MSTYVVPQFAQAGTMGIQQDSGRFNQHPCVDTNRTGGIFIDHNTRWHPSDGETVSAHGRVSGFCTEFIPHRQYLVASYLDPGSKMSLACELFHAGLHEDDMPPARIRQMLAREH